MTAAGLAFSHLRRKTQSLVVPVSVHAPANGIILRFQ